MKSHVIVTGGAGFIGSHIVDYLLKKKFHVTVIDDLSTGRLSNLYNSYKKIKFIKKDINDISKIKINKKVDFVIHAAALADIVPSIDDPEKYFKANVSGTLEVLKFCVSKKIKKIVYAASSSCYGLAKKIPTPENSDIAPQYPYALTKKMGEDLIRHWGTVYKLKYVSLRLFNVYGLRSRTSGNYGAVIGTFLSQKLNNVPVTIVGDGKQKRDFVHITDVAEAFYLSLKSSLKAEILNVGTGKPKSVNELANLISDNKIFIPWRPGEPKVTCAKISKIKNKLKWKPKAQFKNKIKELLDNINAWKKAPVWTRKKIKIATKKWNYYLK